MGLPATAMLQHQLRRSIATALSSQYALSRVSVRSSRSSIVTTSRAFHGSSRNNAFWSKKAASPSSFTSASPASPMTAEQPVVTRQTSFFRRIFLSDRHPIIKWVGRGVLSFVLSIVTLTGGLLLWDATTYRTHNIQNVPVSALALNPKRGGPKNLKIAQMFIGDEEDDQIKALLDKPKLVILGGGWGVSLQACANDCITIAKYAEMIQMLGSRPSEPSRTSIQAHTMSPLYPIQTITSSLLSYVCPTHLYSNVQLLTSLF